MKTIKKSVTMILALTILLTAAAFSAHAGGVEVSTFEQLRAAVGSAVGPTNIIICDDIVFPDYIFIPSGKDITITSSEGIFSLTAESSRHFYTVGDMALSLDSLLLDGVDTGGGIFTEGKLTLTYVTMQRCRTDYLGGAIFSIGGTLTLNECVIINNAAGYGGGGGGAIYSENGVITLNGGVLAGNTAPSGGGAIYCNNGYLESTGCDFFGNEAASGAAVHSNGTAIFNGGRFFGNTAVSGGGGIYNNGGDMYIRGCEFTHNTARNHGGGGIHTNDLTGVWIWDSVFSGNTASKAYWMTDAADIATYNAQISGVTQFSDPPAGNKPFAYAYNNYDISYTNGLAENPDIVTYTVTFKDWDGTVLDEQTVEQGKAAAAPANPVRIGYSFIGWGTDFSNITHDLTVTARYVPHLLNVVPAASVKKLNGNQNELTVIVTEAYHDGSVKVFTKTFMINNNAVGTYEVGPYKVYVDTKGNTQIRSCYIVG